MGEYGARATALILSGAVAKGAFEAGVLSVLAEQRERFPIRRLVGASAGALNAAVYAAGVRAGQERAAAERLEALWRERGGWHDVFKLSLSDVLHLRGAGTAGDVLELLRGAVAGWQLTGGLPVELCTVLTSLSGELGRIGSEPATTYERVAEFRDEDFDSADGWDRICRTALGSAAFPFLFAPIDVPGVGPCSDGGIVNNTPLRWAMQNGIERVIVVSTQPEVLPTPRRFQGTELVAEWVDILINERLYRDLRAAVAVNRRLEQLAELLHQGTLSPEAHAAILQRFDWKPLEIIQIRPREPLEGNAFAAFGNKTLRDEYVSAGRAVAQRALSASGAAPAAS